MRHLLVNLVAFQLGWLACVLGGVRIPDPVAGFAVLAGGWSFLMPFASWLAYKLRGEGARGEANLGPSSASAR